MTNDVINFALTINIYNCKNEYCCYVEHCVFLLVIIYYRLYVYYYNPWHTFSTIFVNVLQDNVTLEKLNLQGNWIEGDGGLAMARMLEDNDYITELVSIRGSVAPVCFSLPTVVDTRVMC